MAIRTIIHCIWRASWQSALMETLAATSLCIGVLGTFFLPHEYSRMTQDAAKRTLNCWPMQDGRAVVALVESVAEQVDSLPAEKCLQWHAVKSPCVLPCSLRLSNDAYYLAFDQPGERLFVGYGDGMLKRFRVDDAEPNGAVIGNVSGLSGVVCTPNGESLLTAGEQGLELWDIQPNGEASLKKSRLLAAGEIDCLAISPCSDTVLAGITTATGSRLVEIDLHRGAAVPLMELPKRLGRILVSADGRRLAAISANTESCKIALLQRASCEASWLSVDFPSLSTVSLSLASLSPDSSLLITCDRFGHSLLVWDLETKTLRQRLDSPTSTLHGCAFLDASHVITWGFNRKSSEASLLPQDEVQIIALESRTINTDAEH